MQRINPTGFVRIGAMSQYVAVYQPRMVIDAASGGLKPMVDDPLLVLQAFAAVEPFELNVVREHLGGGGQILNVAQYLVTMWYRPELRVSQFVIYTDVRSSRERHLEVLVVRDQGEQHRYVELLCQERVS